MKLYDQYSEDKERFRSRAPLVLDPGVYGTSLIRNTKHKTVFSILYSGLKQQEHIVLPQPVKVTPLSIYKRDENLPHLETSR